MGTQEELRQELGIYVAGLLLYTYCIYGWVGAYRIANSYGIGSNQAGRSGLPYIVGVAMGLVFLSFFYKDRKREPIFKRGRNCSFWLIVVCFFFLMGAQFVAMLWAEGLETMVHKAGYSMALEREAASGANGTATMLVYTLVIAPITEEVIFRGYLLKGLKKYGNSVAILTSAILFSLHHANLLQMLFAILMGLLFGYIAAEYSVYLTILLHMANNALVSGMVYWGAVWKMEFYGIEAVCFVLALFYIMGHRRQIADYIETTGGSNLRSGIRNIWMGLYFAMTALVAWQGIIGG